MTRKISPDLIDALLPQTQCGLCNYGACMPYAEALAYDNAPINLCPPGGIKTLRALADLLHEDAEPHVADMHTKAKAPMLARIREEECIGCTKCIAACPVDAIIGASKVMHTVITDACTGCELCVPPCPVDCIDMLVQAPTTDTIQAKKAEQARINFNAREKRLQKENNQKKSLALQQAQVKNKNYVADAIARVKAKKNINL